MPSTRHPPRFWRGRHLRSVPGPLRPLTFHLDQAIEPTLSQHPFAPEQDSRTPPATKLRTPAARKPFLSSRPAAPSQRRGGSSPGSRGGVREKPRCRPEGKEISLLHPPDGQPPKRAVFASPVHRPARKPSCIEAAESKRR